MASCGRKCSLCACGEAHNRQGPDSPAGETASADSASRLISVCAGCVGGLRDIKVLKERVKYLEDEVCRLHLTVAELGGERCATLEPSYASTRTAQPLKPQDPIRTEMAVVGFDDGSIGVMSLETGTLERYMLGAHEDAVGCVVAIQGEGLVLSSSDDGTLGVWEAAGGKRVRSMDHCAGRCIMEGRSVFSAASFGDGRVVSGAEDRLVKLWGAHGEFLFALPGHSGAVYHCTVVHPTRLATCSADATIRVWDVSHQGGTCTHVLQGHGGTVYCAAVCMGGTSVAPRLVSASHDGTLKLWGLADGACEATLTGHLSPVLSVTALKGGDIAVSSSADCSVRVWNLTSRECLQVLEGHTDPVRSLAVMPDEEHILSCSDDATLRVWRKDGQCLRTIDCPKTPCSAILLPSL